MKAKLLYSLFTILMLISSSIGMAGSAVAPASGALPFLQKGPLATPADVTATSDGTSYGLFKCQVGKSVGQCYDPYQMRRAYGIDGLIAQGFDGTGKTIVIVDAFMDPNIAAQLDYFNKFYSLKPVNAGLGTPTFTQVSPDGVPVFDPGWSQEITLDVLWAHAIAPGANIVLEQAADNSDYALISALNDAINNNRGDVISMSFGESDTCLDANTTAAWHQAFVNATKKGITLFASSGDQGAVQPSCDGLSWVKSTSSPASDPLVSAVGGTELVAADYCLPSLGCNPATNPAPGTFLSETAWNEGPSYGDFQDRFDSTIASGGGFSTVWSQPAYQNGTLPGGKARGAPDVAYNAAVMHGVLTYLDFPGVPAGFYRFGGTSAGSPQWAALTAIADQAAGHNYGFINAALYKIGQNAANYALTFHDITSGTNSALEYDAWGNPVDTTGYAAGPGWDAVTGLGSPKAAAVLAQLPLFWSMGQGNAAIAGSMPHPKGTAGPGHVNPN